jgi:hypothetical protein
MNEESKQSTSGCLGLILGFAPTVIVLLCGSGFRGQQMPPWLLAFVLTASVICCFVSSSLLFRRKTLLTIMGGVLFLVVNAFISAFLGCLMMVGGGIP